MTTRIATANVHVDYTDHAAEVRLREVLAKRPHVVGLQEWPWGRAHILRDHGRVARGRDELQRLRRPGSGMVWTYPDGHGQPVGVDVDWGELLSVAVVRVSRARPGARASYATVPRVREHDTGRLHVFWNFHLLAHHDEPENRRAWAEGKARLQKAARLAPDDVRVWAMGDGNKDPGRDTMDLSPLHSCWEGHRDLPTFGRRRTIDAIWGEVKAKDVGTVKFAGDDHDGVWADY